AKVSCFTQLTSRARVDDEREMGRDAATRQHARGEEHAVEASASALGVVHLGRGAGETQSHGGGRVSIEMLQRAREMPSVADEAVRMPMFGEQIDDASELRMQQRLTPGEAHRVRAEECARLLEDRREQLRGEALHRGDVVTDAVRAAQVAVLREREADLHGYQRVP